MNLKLRGFTEFTKRTLTLHIYCILCTHMVKCVYCACHFDLYKPGKPRGTEHKGQNRVEKSSPLSWAGQYKSCVQYDFKFTPVL